MPVRKIVRPTGRGVRGRFPSRKMGRMISWESLLERDAILRFEFSPGVVQYEEQPQNIYYEQDGLTRHYIPDFELLLQSGEPVHVEVKPSSKLLKADLATKYSAIAKYYESMSTAFRILTEKEIRAEPSLSNLHRLARYLPRHWDECLDGYVEALALLPAKTFAGAVAVCGEELAVYRLLASGRYRCNLAQPIAGNTTIHPAGEESEDAALLF